jgi:hypothetical protein
VSRARCSAQLLRSAASQNRDPGYFFRNRGPRLCSAPLREELRAALRPGHKPMMAQAKKFFTFLIPVPKTSLILLVSCPVRARFLKAILHWTERELAGPGRPGTVDRLVAKVERWEAPRPTSLGARGWRYQLREVGTLIPPPRVLRKRLGASRRSIAPAKVRWWRSSWQTSDAPRRENAEAWLFESVDQNFGMMSQHTRRHTRA